MKGVKKMESKEEEERKPFTDEENIAYKRLRQKIGSLDFDGVDRIEVKCILKSNNGGKTWILYKQLSDIIVDPGNMLASLDVEGIELWDIGSELEKKLRGQVKGKIPF